jgi:hypothetical protein
VRRAAIAAALAVPVMGIAIERAAIAPLGDSVAKTLVGVAAIAAPSPAPSAITLSRSLAPIEASTGGAQDERRPRRTAARGESARRRETIDREKDKDGGAAPASPALDAAPKGTISVPASAVTRAIEKRDVSATNATDAAGKPLGARLVGVSRYGTGLHDGDVVVSVSGTRTPTVDAMVGAAMSAATSGARSLHGKILRGDAIYAVVLALPDHAP